MRDTRRELDHFETAGQRTLGIDERLAVLLRHDARKIFLVRVQQFPKPHQDARTSQRRRGAPSGKRVGGRLHGGIHVGRVRERHMADYFAGRGVRHLAIAGRGRLKCASADP